MLRETLQIGVTKTDADKCRQRVGVLLTVEHELIRLYHKIHHNNVLTVMIAAICFI